MANTVERIKDKNSFDTFTKEPHQIAGLYFYMILDCLVDLAHKISRDFFKRPHLYINLTDTKKDKEADTKINLSELLAKLHARYGSDEKLPSKEQRFLIFEPIFGQSSNNSTNENSDFPRLRDQLVYACAAFAERVYDTGVEMLKERVRTTHRPFKEYLKGLQGASVTWSRDVLSNITEDTAYQIIRNKGVDAVFGISDPPQAFWPYGEDSNGDKLVEMACKQLMADDASKMYLTREYFSNLQRVALRGSEAIAEIIDFDESKSDNDLLRLITKCYNWGSALKSIAKAPVRT